jgi:glucokinase
MTAAPPHAHLPYVGVDVGATKTAVGIGTHEGRLLAKRVVPTVLGDPDAQADLVAATIAGLRWEVPPTDGPTAIGIGICGGVERDGMVHGPIALGWPDPVDFAALVEARTGVRATIDNDVTAGAIAEHRWGAGRGIDDFMYLAIGTGIGAGLVLNGRLYRGARNLAGEIGHLSVDVDGLPCACGNRGCIEASCGGKPASDHLSARLAGPDAGASPGLQHVLRTHGMVTTRDLFAHAAVGDAFAQREVERMALHLAAAIVNVVNLLDLDRVVVGGGQVQNRVLLPAIQRALQDWRPYLAHDRDLVVPAGLGEDAGLIGALGVVVEAEELRRAAAATADATAAGGPASPADAAAASPADAGPEPAAELGPASGGRTM